MSHKSAPAGGDKSAEAPFGVSAPRLSLPKGGGAVRGIGEKFSANPVTGTGALHIPVATSPGRGGFGPQLSLSYDSGSGNGAFGIGWSLALPSITRQTDKGLPQYRDHEASDVFILSGAEDLVPVFKQNADGSWPRDANNNLIEDEESRSGYLVKRYRPRIEGLFARIERWTRQSDGDTHWRSISRDNILTVYGGTAESRIADPADPARVFSWLICQSYDDKGNAIVYDYAGENDDHVDLSQVNERNRLRSAARYLKAIRYGNRQPLLIDPNLASFRRLHVPAPDFGSAGWMFEVVFDYGEGHYREAPPDSNGRTFAEAASQVPVGGKWPARLDPFSSYRSCFEVRSYRLCRRVLMFHHFPEELGVEGYLVRSTGFAYRESACGSCITQVLQSGFKRIASPVPRYLKRSLPPLEFAYSLSPLEDLSFDKLPLQEVDEPNLRNMPGGIDGTRHRWVDLDGEGIAGVFSEQADAWFYKRNLGDSQFGPLECVTPRPSLATPGRGRQQLLDLAGDGKVDLVDFASPAPGFFPRTMDAGWDNFRTFVGLPNINWQDPQLRFVDLTGDGRADVLITEDNVFFTWHESRAEQGFDAARRVSLPFDEEIGPRLVFADGTQSIFLADMSGDGLTDLVRIRNSEVSYWPNIGYGRFGARVTMDNVPCFDDEASFDQRRVQLADTDGSGPADIIYLGREGVRVYLNQHGNSLSDARLLAQMPRTDHYTSVSVVDFLGRGTACLLWCSPLPGDANRPLRYLDLMGGIKPHLLTAVRNNLGAETHIEYASSTKFYLADKKAGTPWVTRLPFPVHVVTRVETSDLISGNRFATTYTYHHGYFDSVEREFRGFARVEQQDTEEFGVLSRAGMATNLDAAFHVPPVLTRTWFHTGAYLAGDLISRHLENEYYREDEAGGELGASSAVRTKAMLLEDTVLPGNLAMEETREAMRSLKGAILRQEIYALDNKPESGRPYSVSERNYTIKSLQPRDTNRHAVFFTHARESVDFHYERKLFPVLNGKIVDPATAAANPATRWCADPRVMHTVTLDADEYGNVRQAVAIAYGRRFDDADVVLTDADRELQKHLQVSLTQASFTNAVLAVDAYRAPLPADTQSYELVKLQPQATHAGINNLFRFDELVALITRAGDGAHDIPYEDVHATGAIGAGPWRRLIEDQRTRYRSDNLTQLLPLQNLQALGLTGESYKLALTPGLLTATYKRRRAGQTDEDLLPDPGAVLRADHSAESDRGGYVDLDGDGRWWVASGRTFFHVHDGASPPDELAEAARHFFLPRRYRNPFAQSMFVDYTSDLFPLRTRDALGNTAEAAYDFRVLQAKLLTDINGNRSIVAFDTFGLPVAMAVQGKASEAVGDRLDELDDFDLDPTLAQLQAFIANPAGTKSSLLKGASSRIVYDLERYRRCGEPPFAASLVREVHASDVAPEQVLNIQTSFVYSDGFGRELQSKIQAEPGAAPARAANGVLASGDISPGALQRNAAELVLAAANPRWVGKGRLVYNNKGKPVKQYEPFFSTTHLYEPEREMTDTGVTPILFYDPIDRVVATLHPNHTYEKVVFDPWRQQTWDVNDTVVIADPKNDPDVGEYFKLLPASDYLPTWYSQRIDGQQGIEEKTAAEKAAAHAATPAVSFFDTMGRPCLTIADNGKDADGIAQKYATRVVLDIESNQREVIDARSRIVMRYDYDMLGNRIHQASMEAGERWILNDVGGNPIRAWDSRNHSLRTQYDQLRRPRRAFVVGADLANVSRETCFERNVYGESSDSGLTTAQAVQANVRGRLHKHYDTAGLVTSEAHDFKGNLLRSTRQLAKDYKSTPDWTQNPQPMLETETFASSTRYDALNRPIQVIAPHSNQPDTKFNIIRPGYNEANLLERVDAWLAQSAQPESLLNPATANLHAVLNIDYDAKGQRSSIAYGNGASTGYFYDPQTFRLIHLKTSRNGPAPALLQDLFYTHDPVGNITHIHDGAQQSIYFSGQVVLPACDYSYDAVYRLISAAGREHIGQLARPESSWSDEFRVNLQQPGDGRAMRNYTEQYEYDAVGNFERLVHLAANGNWTRVYTCDEASLIEPGKRSNRLSSTSIGAATEAYTHDAHGNMTGMSHLTLMRWDFKDRLSATSRQVVNNSPPPDKTAETTFYTYDSGGERIRKVTERQNGARKSERIYLPGFEIYHEFDGNNDDVALKRETLHMMDGKQRIALVEMLVEGNDGSPEQLVRYQLGNHLGSASLELDEEGSVISYEEYFSYGGSSYQSVDQSIKAAKKRYRYTGKERDEETGFAYHSARYYPSWLGRWVNCDPLFDPSGTSRYAYVHDKPVNRLDPDGRDDRFYDSHEFAIETTKELLRRTVPGIAELEDVGVLDRPADSLTAKRAQKLGESLAAMFLVGELLSGFGPNGRGGPQSGGGLELAPATGPVAAKVATSPVAAGRPQALFAENKGADATEKAPDSEKVAEAAHREETNSPTASSTKSNQYASASPREPNQSHDPRTPKPSNDWLVRAGKELLKGVSRSLKAAAGFIHGVDQYRGGQTLLTARLRLRDGREIKVAVPNEGAGWRDGQRESAIDIGYEPLDASRPGSGMHAEAELEAFRTKNGAIVVEWAISRGKGGNSVVCNEGCKNFTENWGPQQR